MSAAIQPRVSGCAPSSAAPGLSAEKRLRQRMRAVAEHAVLHLHGTQVEDALQRLCINRGSVHPPIFLLVKIITQMFY